MGRVIIEMENGEKFSRDLEVEFEDFIKRLNDTKFIIVGKTAIPVKDILYIRLVEERRVF